MYRLATLLALCPVLLLAGCGGSTHASSSSSATASSTAPSVSGTASVSGPSSTVKRPPEVPPGTKTVRTTSSGASGTTGTTSAGGGTQARLPATFTIRAGGVQPPTVSAPLSVPVYLTLVSGDGRAHTAQLRTFRPRTLRVPAHGRTSVLLTGLPAGRYVIEIDGVTNAAVVIGVQPGP
jgi:hypothetical protein